MVQKFTIVIPIDKCGVYTANTFHLYKGFFRKFSKFGEYIKISIRKTKPENTLTKKTKKKAIIVRTKKKKSICDGSSIRFDHNGIVILKKRLTPEGKEIFGPILRSFKKKKIFIFLFGINLNLGILYKL